VALSWVMKAKKRDDVLICKILKLENVVK